MKKSKQTKTISASVSNEYIYFLRKYKISPSVAMGLGIAIIMHEKNHPKFNNEFLNKKKDRIVSEIRDYKLNKIKKELNKIIESINI